MSTKRVLLLWYMSWNAARALIIENKLWIGNTINKEKRVTRRTRIHWNGGRAA